MRNVVEEFKNSCLVERGYGGSHRRSDRYAPRKAYQIGTRMIPFFKDLIYRSLGNEELDPDGIYQEEIKKISSTSARYFKHGIIAKYNDYIGLFFADVPGLDTCGLRLTYTEEEFNRTLEFISRNKGTALINAFMAFGLDYLLKMQNINLIKELPTYGVVYTFSVTERYILMGDHCARIIYHDGNSIDMAAYNAAQSALFDRDVPLEELEAILPDGPEAKLFARKYIDFEISQIEYLERHIAAEA